MEKDGKAEAETGSRGQGGEAREETRNQGGRSQGQQRPEQDRETPVCACTSTPGHGEKPGRAGQSQSPAEAGGRAPVRGGRPTWLVADHAEHSGLALVPDWLQGDGGRHEGGGLGGPSPPAPAQRSTHHLWVRAVGQPQGPQVELLLELGLLGVQLRELLPDLPATCAQTLILGILGMAREWGGSLNQCDLDPRWQNLRGGCSLPLWTNILDFLSGTSPHHHMACLWNMTQARPTGLEHSIPSATVTGSKIGM